MTGGYGLGLRDCRGWVLASLVCARVLMLWELVLVCRRTQALSSLVLLWVLGEAIAAA